MNWKLIFNPFSKFTEQQLLWVGILATFAGCIIGSYFQVVFDGALDVHPISEITFWEGMKILLIDIFSVVLLLFILGKIINSKTRIIDILNTVLISRIPLYILGIFANNSKMNEITETLIENIDHPEKMQLQTSDMMIMMIFSVFSLLFLAYHIVLLVFGFKTATNTKKWQHFVLFTLILLIAEMLSKFLLTFL